MFRLLIFFIILGFVIVAVYAGIKIVQSLKQTETKKPTTTEDVEHLIDMIKLKITRAELSASEGIEGAEKDLEYWKNQLEEVNKLKQKTSNLK